MIIVRGPSILRIIIPPLNVDFQPSQPWDMVRDELSDGREAVCDAIGVRAGEREGCYGACVDGADDAEECYADREAQGRGLVVWVIV